MHIRKNKAWFEQNSYLMLFLHGVNNSFLRLSVLRNPGIIFLLEFCEAHLLIVAWLDLCSRVLVMLTHGRLHVISYFASTEEVLGCRVCCSESKTMSSSISLARVFK